MTMSIAEQAARIIEPFYWGQFDNALRPYAESRGAYSALNESQLYMETWRSGCRCVEDIRSYFFEDPIDPTTISSTTRHQVRASLEKAKAILALTSQPTTPETITC